MTLKELVEALQEQAKVGGCAEAQVRLAVPPITAVEDLASDDDGDDWLAVVGVEYEWGYVLIRGEA